MSARWPADTVFTQQILTVEQQECSVCGHDLTICDHRYHHIFTLNGPLEIICKLAHCPDRACAAHSQTLSPLAEAQITLPRWRIGWDVFCWMGYRRFAQHWSVPQLQAELRDTYQIRLSDDAITDSLGRYKVMVAARQQDASVLAEVYRDRKSLILSIDGLQPEKGHEVLYVVRELGAKRIWFAQALLSSSTAEIMQLIYKAKQWADQLGKPVEVWISDKQDAFVKAIAAEFPGVAHRYCQNHFLRDVAKPMLDADSHAKVKMRQKVRGLRAIERQVQDQQREEAAASVPASPNHDDSPQPLSPKQDDVDRQLPIPATRDDSQAAKQADPTLAPLPGEDVAAKVVLSYCSAVRGILNDSQGGPLQPPGLRMAEALQDVRESLQRNLDAKKGGELKLN
jgi:hypothetical protein